MDFLSNVVAKQKKLWSELNALDIKEESHPLSAEEKLEKEQSILKLVGRF